MYLLYNVNFSVVLNGSSHWTWHFVLWKTRKKNCHTLQAITKNRN